MAAAFQENGAAGEDDATVDVHATRGTPIRYLPLDHLYSATSPCRVAASGSSNVMSKKVKARKLTLAHFADHHRKTTSSPPTSSSLPPKPPLLFVYSRRRKRRADSDADRRLLKKRKIGSTELERLGGGLNAAVGDADGPRWRECRSQFGNSGAAGNVKCGSLENLPKLLPESRAVKKWVGLSFDDADPEAFVGLRCKVYWPMDLKSYTGYVRSYDKETKIHHVKYDDGDEENLILSNENIRFHVSRDEMKHLKLSFAKVRDNNVSDYDVEEMLALAASLDDCQDFEPGDIIWAKLTGHAMWPAVVLDESLASNCKGLKMFLGGRSVPVQFFGTHDFARVRLQQVKSFLSGLLTELHSKCKKHSFIEGLEEAKRYLSEQKLPLEMLELQKRCTADDCNNASGEEGGCTDSGDDCLNDKGTLMALENSETFPYEVGDLQILSLGKIVEDSAFGDGRLIWPEGYMAVRKFTSVTDPKVSAPYKMEVLRDPESKVRPLFRVTVDGGEQFNGYTPSACWGEVYKRIKKMEKDASEGIVAEGGVEKGYESGSDMFGFSNPKVVKLIQGLSKSKISSKNSSYKLGSRGYNNLPLGYRQVHINWFDLDKCNVCHMDEEYENNLFLQCDKCRMMVHARCYGELEPVNGVLWLCNLCRSGAPPPPCCLCPLIGGAMKPTTDGRWAHLACAMWIPETCLADVKRMEPIDGLSRISKDRWKLLCSICGVSYGACIQCSNSSCRVAYHPLCARAAGLCVELENEDRLYLLSVDDDEDQCIRLLSFCKKHRQPSNEHSVADERIVRVAGQCSDYEPPPNPSGCARSEPYDYFGRRGRKEPEALAAASLKRLFVENQPYLVGGYCQHGSLDNLESCGRGVCSKFFCSQQRLRTSLIDASNSILSISEKYKYMRETFRKRLAFGKSRIHGFGIFAKHPYKGGDMVIEYTGELVRPPIADRREHFIYNSLVGAGTYMFRIDDERVIDATRAGSIAHLINHSCAPNCYSRVISVNGDEHIIIFAKRDIKQWEELTYDYRFFSIDERLACYCGFPKCRGVVNDTEAEERAATLYAPRSELIDWRGE
ncbi:histone-lysine N-methyltransferase ATX2 [Cajanus cajan]|uniref:Histone-lysine N-methyltransferase ATX2 n=1 Tax=Cajanus cajan TaxID=3821 RepID=A0A151TCT2_CAJCA|nr:histone-lysine N-methyltransferase ATX2 [Cajanus cajan]XP_029128075.1 histone-lysine N-methyltransferase ATX2 [Cajanus cajan]KYP64848.1 Histone-lysine N-methyltransferase ATX2 [Cajanus cajan]